MVGQNGNNHEQVMAMIDKIKLKGANTSEYEKALLKWYKNIDKGYAWVVLVALWFVFGTMLGSYRTYSLIFAKVTTEGIYSREEASWPVQTIYTVKNLISPLISISLRKLNFQSTMLIGGVLVVSANCFAALSSSIYVDVLFIGIVQGVGYSFIIIPFWEIVNNYFIKYRNFALGCALSGGTISVLGLVPLFKLILDSYPWRFAYYGIGLVCCAIVLLSPLFKSNQMPKPEMFENGKIVFVENNNNSKTKQAKENHSNISKDIEDIERETISVNEVSRRVSNFTASNIWMVLKTPPFHLIWYCDLMYLWIDGINCLVLVDFSIDHGLTKEDSQSMIIFEVIGEVFGRLVLTALVDMRFISNKNVVVLILMMSAGSLTAITYVTSYIWMATFTTANFALLSLLFIMINGLLIDYLGEQQVTLGYGMACFIVGLLVTVMPLAVGFCRDNLGSYDPLMRALALSCLLGALLWMIEPIISKSFGRKNK